MFLTCPASIHSSVRSFVSYRRQLRSADSPTLAVGSTRRSATAHFAWQLHAPGTARQLLGTRRHFFPSGAAWRHVCLNWHWRDTDFILRLHFVCDFSISVKCPCNVTYDSVTLIFTFLIIIITKLVITMFWKQMIASFDASWHKWSAAQRHETVHFGGQEVKDKGLVFGGHEVKDKGHVRQEIDLKAWQSRHSQPACVEQLF